MAVEVVGAVIVKDNKILAARRPLHKTLGGLWEFPGGKIDVGETQALALKREIKEELKCEVEVNDFIVKEVYTYDFGDIALSTFFCTLKNGEPIATEHIELRWLAVNELNDVEWAPADYPTLDILKSGKLKG
ncbi:MAG: (deoxy)nucleoside triphosphate pyrophosphohydrolase [Erysipelothrix sp.]|nr:(deoxy)nucleoside triphosphate pyrophosphohydrolase [Erysipelothrix sp.]